MEEEEEEEEGMGGFLVGGSVGSNEEDDDEYEEGGTGIKEVRTKSPEELLRFARLAEKTENFEDMRIFMQCLAAKKDVLEVEERDLLAMAYKHVVGKRRSSWRLLWEMLQQQEEEERDMAAAQAERMGASAGPYSEDTCIISTSLDSKNGRLSAALQMECIDSNSSLDEDGGFGRLNRDPLAVMAQVVRGELEDLCLELIDQVRTHLLENLPPQQFECLVFYQKLIADYYRYLSEHSQDGARRRHFIAEASYFYEAALEISKVNLDATNPLHLGLVLNISVFNFEILSTPDKACELAKSAYDAAASSMDRDNTEKYKEAEMLLDLLRENLTIWTLSELSEET